MNGRKRRVTSKIEYKGKCYAWWYTLGIYLIKHIPKRHRNDCVQKSPCGTKEPCRWSPRRFYKCCIPEHHVVHTLMIHVFCNKRICLFVYECALLDSVTDNFSLRLKISATPPHRPIARVARNGSQAPAFESLIGAINKIAQGHALGSFVYECALRDSNPRHQQRQCCALPTELSARMGNYSIWRLYVGKKRGVVRYLTYAFLCYIIYLYGEH